MKTKIQVRRDIAANWTQNNPVLSAGELGFESDTGKFKIGNSSLAWTLLPYAAVLPSDLDELSQDAVNSALVAGTGLDKTYNDGANTITLDIDSTVTTNSGTQTLTNKTLTSPVVSGLTLSDSSIIFEGSVADEFETTLTVINPTADRTVTIPDATTTLVGTDISQTLTNKTLNSPIINNPTFTGQASGLEIAFGQSVIFEGTTADDNELTLSAGNPTSDRTITLPDATDTLVGLATTDTLTNKTIDLTSNTLRGTVAEFNTALEDDNFVTLTGTETLTNKTLTSPTVSGLFLSDQSIVFEGVTPNEFETTLSVEDPTADRSLTLPNKSGTVAVTTDITNAIDALTTTDIEEGTNLYYTNERVDDRLNELLVAGTGITKTYDDLNNSLTVAVDTGVIASKVYVDEVAQGLIAKPAVDVATTANVTATYANGTAGVGATLTIAATATLNIDGKTSWVQYDSVLFKNQTNKAENGRYVLTTVGGESTDWIFTRCGLCDTANEIPGAYIFVTDGTANHNTGWVLSVNDPNTFVVGTDDIDVYQFSGAGTYTAGNGLTLTGSAFSINTNTTVDLSTAQTLTNKTISGNSNIMVMRSDTAANWSSLNPILSNGELAIESDTLKIKRGDGTSNWNSISGYVNVTPTEFSTATASLEALILGLA